MIQQDLLVCPICFLPFNLSTQIPKGINCGHTVCLTCAGKMFNSNGNKCCLEVKPFDVNDLNDDIVKISQMLSQRQSIQNNIFLQKRDQNFSNKDQINPKVKTRVNRKLQYKEESRDKSIESKEDILTNNNSQENSKSNFQSSYQGFKIQDNQFSHNCQQLSSLSSPNQINNQSNNLKDIQNSKQLKKIQQAEKDIKKENFQLKETLKQKQITQEMMQQQFLRIEGKFQILIDLQKKKLKNFELNEKNLISQVNNLQQQVLKMKNYVVFLEKQNKDMQIKINLLRQNYKNCINEVEDQRLTQKTQGDGVITEQNIFTPIKIIEEYQEKQEERNNSEQIILKQQNQVNGLRNQLSQSQQQVEELTLQIINLEDENNRKDIQVKDLETKLEMLSLKVCQKQQQNISAQEDTQQVTKKSLVCKCDE